MKKDWNFYYFRRIAMNKQIIDQKSFNIEEYIESKNRSFDDWNEEKKEIYHNGKLKLVKPWEIWLCKIWMNIGWEMSKGNVNYFQRPVLVISTRIWWDLACIIPFSTQPAKSKDTEKFTIPFIEREKHGLDKPTNLILNQLRIVSIKRLKRAFNNIPRGNNGIIPLVGKKYINNLLEIFIERILLKKTSLSD